MSRLPTDLYPADRVAALRKLLDDPSPQVRAALMGEFERGGAEAIQFLRSVTSGDEGAVAEAARGYLRDLGAEDTVEAFIRFVRSYGYELETGSILLDRTFYPALEASEVCLFLDQVALRVRQLLIHPTPLFGQCRVLNRVLFHEFGFRGDRETFYDPANGFLHKVIERRRGLPISLAIIYLLVAERCGIDLEPIGFPGRFMVGCFGEGEPFYVDVFENGAFRTREELMVELDQLGVPMANDYFLPLPVGGVLMRCCRNLGAHFERAGQHDSAQLYLRLVAEFEACHEDRDDR